MHFKKFFFNCRQNVEWEAICNLLRNPIHYISKIFLWLSREREMGNHMCNLLGNMNQNLQTPNTLSDRCAKHYDVTRLYFDRECTKVGGWVLYPWILWQQYICIVKNYFYLASSRESVKWNAICIYREQLVRLKQGSVGPVICPGQIFYRLKMQLVQVFSSHTHCR